MFHNSALGLLILLLLSSWSTPPAASEVYEPAVTVVSTSPTQLTEHASLVSLLYEDRFHNTTMLQEEIDNIAALAPDIVDVSVIGQTYQGRNITCIRITNESLAHQKAKVLVIAQHHGREQITIELALRFSLLLINGFGSDAAITDYLNTEEVYIIPALNLDALELVVNENMSWIRKNMRPYDNDGDGLFDEDPEDDANGDGYISAFDVYEKHGSTLDYLYSYFEGIDDDSDGVANEDEKGLVDLNRNYGKWWGFGDSSTNPLDQTYHGSGPFSEPETATVRDFVLQHRFAMAYSLHSGTNATYFPTDLSRNWAEWPLYYSIYNDLDLIIPESFNSGSLNAQTTGIRSQLEAAAGGYWEEWMYYEGGAVVPICFEVYHDGAADAPESITIVEDNSTHQIQEWHAIYEYFDPPPTRIDTLWDELKEAFIYLLETTPRLVVEVKSIIGAVSLGSSITLDMEISCRSNRLGSIEDIQVVGPDDTVIDTLAELEADGVYDGQVQVTLPDVMPEDGLVLSIGNNYAGFSLVVITEQAGPDIWQTLSQYAPFIVGGVALVVVLTLVRVWTRRGGHLAQTGSSVNA